MPDPKINKHEMAANYGFALEFMNSDPELKTLFNKAVKNTWTADKFTAMLRNTKWFKHNSANVRNAIAQQTSDPATWKSNVAQMHAQIKDQWGAMFGQAPMPEDSLKTWAQTAVKLGWSQGQLIDHMTSSLNWQKELTASKLGGTAAETKSQIEQLLSQYGVSYGDSWKNGQIKNVLNGSQTAAGIQEQVKNLAKQTYSAFASQIDGGMTVDQIADPYRQKMADLLEMNPNSIGVKDRTLQKALTATNNATGQPAAMSLGSFGDMLRKDSRWQYTDNARQSVSDSVLGMLQHMGLA